MYQKSVEQTYVDGARELLDLIGPTNNHTLNLGTHPVDKIITRQSVADSLTSYDAWYSSHFVDILLHSLTNNSNIQVYAAITMDYLSEYNKAIIEQKEDYAFVPLNVSYNKNVSKILNHWTALVIEKKCGLVFYLDPAIQNNIPDAVNELKKHLEVIEPVIFNPIDFQREEKGSTLGIRHCGMYMVEIFKIINEAVSKKLAINKSALGSILSAIPCGLAAATKSIRQQHILKATAIIQTIKAQCCNRNDKTNHPNKPIIAPLLTETGVTTKNFSNASSPFPQKEKLCEQKQPVDGSGTVPGKKQKAEVIAIREMLSNAPPVKLIPKKNTPSYIGPQPTNKRPISSCEPFVLTVSNKRKKPSMEKSKSRQSNSASITKFMGQSKQLAENIHERFKRFRMYLKTAGSLGNCYSLAELYYDIAILFYEFFYHTEGHFNLQPVKDYLEKSINLLNAFDGLEDKLDIVIKAKDLLEKIENTLVLFDSAISSLVPNPATDTVEIQINLLQLYLKNGNLEEAKGRLQVLSKKYGEEVLEEFSQIHQCLEILNAITERENTLLSLPVNAVHPILIKQFSNVADYNHFLTAWQNQVKSFEAASLCILGFPDNSGGTAWRMQLKRCGIDSGDSPHSIFTKSFDVKPNSRLPALFNVWANRPYAIPRHDDVLDILNQCISKECAFKRNLPLSRRALTMAYFEDLCEQYAQLTHDPLSKRFHDAWVLLQQEQHVLFAEQGLLEEELSASSAIQSKDESPAVAEIHQEAFRVSLLPAVPKVGVRALNDKLTEQEWFFEVLPYLDKVPGLISSLNPVHQVKWWFVDRSDKIQALLAGRPLLEHTFQRTIVFIYVDEYLGQVQSGFKNEKQSNIPFYVYAEQEDKTAAALEGRVGLNPANLAPLAQHLRGIRSENFIRLRNGKMLPNPEIKEKEALLKEILSPQLKKKSTDSSFLGANSFLQPLSKIDYETCQRSQTGVLVYDLNQYEDCKQLRNRFLKNIHAAWASIVRIKHTHYIALLVAVSTTHRTIDGNTGQCSNSKLSEGTVYYFNSNLTIDCVEALQWLTGAIGDTEYKLCEVSCPPQRVIGHDSLPHAYLNAVTALWAWEKGQWDFVKEHLAEQRVSSASNIEQCKKWLLNPQGVALPAKLDAAILSDIQRSYQHLNAFREQINRLLNHRLKPLPPEKILEFVKEAEKALLHVKSLWELEDFLDRFLGTHALSDSAIEGLACKALLQSLTKPDEKGVAKVQLNELTELIATTIQQIADSILGYHLETTKKFEAFEDKFQHASLVFTFTCPPLTQTPALLVWSPAIKKRIEQLGLGSEPKDIKQAYGSLVQAIEAELTAYTDFPVWHAILTEQCMQLKTVIEDTQNPVALYRMMQQSWNELYSAIVITFANATESVKQIVEVYQQVLCPCYDDLSLQRIQVQLQQDVYPHIAQYTRDSVGIKTCLETLLQQAKTSPSVAFQSKLTTINQYSLEQIIHPLMAISPEDERTLHYINAYLRTRMMELLRQYLDELHQFRLQTNEAMETVEQALHGYLLVRIKAQIETGRADNSATWLQKEFRQFKARTPYDDQLRCYQQLTQALLKNTTSSLLEGLYPLQRCLRDPSHSHMLYLEKKGLSLQAMMGRFAALEDTIASFSALFKDFLLKDYDTLDDEDLFSSERTFAKAIIHRLKQSVGFDDILRIVNKNSALVALIYCCQRFTTEGDDKGSAEISGCLRECLLRLAQTYLAEVFAFRKKAKEGFLQFEKKLLEGLSRYDVVSNKSCHTAIEVALDNFSRSKSLKGYHALVSELHKLPRAAKTTLITKKDCTAITSILEDATHTHAPYLDYYLNRLQQLIRQFVNIGEVNIDCRDDQDDDEHWLFEVRVFATTLTQAIDLIRQCDKPFNKPGNEIRIVCAQVLYLDTNLNCPGVSIVLIGPTQALKPGLERCRLSTKGGDGEDKPKAASGQGMDETGKKGKKGADGEDGGPGHSAGHVLLAANDLPRLTIEAQGGRGGRGGHGGDGAKGVDGQDGDDAKTPSINEPKKFFIRCWDAKKDKASVGASPNRRKRRLGKDGEPGAIGGDAGNAGFGGTSGDGGTVQKISLNASVKNHSYTVARCQTGIEGTPGSPGESGKHGRDGRDVVLVINYYEGRFIWCGSEYCSSSCSADGTVYDRKEETGKGRIIQRERYENETETNYHTDFSMLEFEEEEKAPRFIGKYNDSAPMQRTAIATVKHTNQKTVKPIKAINKQAVFKATEQFFSNYTNPQSNRFCLWLAPALNAFLQGLAEQLDCPWNGGYALPEPDADYQALIGLQQQFQAALQQAAARLAAEKLNTRAFKTGTLVLSAEMRQQYQELAALQETLYQVLQTSIQAVDVNQLSTGLGIRSTRIAELRAEMNRVMNAHRLQQRLAKQQTEAQTLREVPQETLADSLLKRQNIWFIPNYKLSKKKLFFRSYIWGALSSECRMAMDIFDGLVQFTSEVNPHYLLTVGQCFIDCDIPGASNPLSSLQKKDWAQFFYVYQELLKQWPKEMHGDCLSQQIKELEKRQDNYPTIKNAVYRLNNAFYPSKCHSLGTSAPKSGCLEEARETQAKMIRQLLEVLQKGEYLPEFEGALQRLKGSQTSLDAIVACNELLTTLIDSLQADGGLLIHPMEFLQVLHCIACFDAVQPVTHCLVEQPQPYWLKVLLVEHWQEKAKGLFPNQSIQGACSKLLTIDVRLVRLFHNVFFWQYRDQLQQAVEEKPYPQQKMQPQKKPIEIPLYRQISYEKCEIIINAMKGVIPTPVVLKQLAHASLTIWEDILQEVKLSDWFNGWMVEWGINRNQEHARIEQCLLILNRIRVELGSSGYPRFCNWLETIKTKVNEAPQISALTPLHTLLNATRTKIISLEQAESIVKKHRYAHWESYLPAIPLSRLQPQTLSEKVKTGKTKASSKERISSFEAKKNPERDYCELLVLMKRDTACPLDNLMALNIEKAIKNCKIRIDAWKEEYPTGAEQTFIQTTIQQWRDNQAYQDNPEAYIRADLDSVVPLLIYAWGVAYEQKVRDSQLVALYLIIYTQNHGLLEQVCTGEGKTLIVGLIAAFMALCGLAVDIVSSNRDLAKEGEHKCHAFFKLLKLDSDHLCHEEEMQNHQAYAKSIVYGEVSTFQRDILETNFNKNDIFGKRYKNKDNQCLIVDEVDNMCLDKARHVLYLSHEIESLKWLESLFLHIWSEVLQQLQSIDLGKLEIHIAILAETITARLKNKDVWAPVYLWEFIEKKLTGWIESAFRAAMMPENDEFVFDTDKSSPQNAALQGKSIIVLDKDTGTEQYATRWSQGLAQFLELKYRRRLSVESLKAVFISNKHFFQGYGKRLYGLTGTLGSQHSQEFLTQVYGVQFAKVPTAREKRYRQLPSKVAFTQTAWIEAIVTEAKEQLEHRPVLIISENLVVSEVLLWQECLQQGIPHHSIKKYTRDGDNIEEAFRKKKATVGDLIIATNKGGRGTDIWVDEGMDWVEGLHVILTYLPSNERIEEQAFGRTARNGACGTGQFVIQLESKKYLSEYQLELLPEAALKPRLDELADILLEREKIERDNIESARLSDLKQKNLLRLETEEALFQQFSELSKTLTEDYWKPVAGLSKKAKIPNNSPVTGRETTDQSNDNEATSPAQTIVESLDAMVKDRWAFWLDLQKHALDKVETVVEQQVILAQFADAFAKPIKDALAKASNLKTILELMQLPEAMNRLGRAYWAAGCKSEKNSDKEKKYYQDAKLCFEAAIEKGDASGFSHIGWAFCAVNDAQTKDAVLLKKQVRHQLKKALDKLEALKHQTMANIQIAELLSQINPSEVLQSVSSNENHLHKQTVGKLEVIGLQLHFLKKAVGDYLEPFHFCFSALPPSIYLLSTEDELPKQWRCCGKDAYHEVKNYQPYRGSYLIIQQPLALWFVKQDATPVKLDIDVSKLELEKLLETFLTMGPLVPLQKNISEGDLKQLKALIVKANPKHQLFALSIEEQGQYLYDLLVEHEILHGLRLKRSATTVLLTKGKAELTEVVKNLILEKLDPSIAKDILQILSNKIDKKATLLPKELEDIVCSEEELWALLTQGKTAKEDVYVADLARIEKGLPDNHAILWRAIKHQIDPLNVDMTVLEGTVAKEGLKQHLLEAKWLIQTERMALKGVDLKTLLAPLTRHNKYGKVIVHQKEKQSSLKDYLEGLLTAIYQNSEMPYVCQTFMPFDTKANEAKKVIGFLKFHSILKAGGLMQKYKHGADRQEAMQKKLQTMVKVKKYSLLDFYQTVILQSLCTAQGDIRSFDEGLKASIKHFFELEVQEDVPQELKFFTGLGLDNFLIFIEAKSWWDWRAFAVAMIGVAQVVVGALLVVSGVGAWVGQALICEGINDMVYATIAGLSGTFSWKVWGIQKAISFTLSMVGGYLLNEATQAIKTAKIADIAAQEGISIAEASVKYAQAARATQVAKLAAEKGISLGEASAQLARQTFVKLGSISPASVFGKTILQAMSQYALGIGQHYLTEAAMQTIGQTIGEGLAAYIEKAVMAVVSQALKMALQEFAKSNSAELKTCLTTLHQKVQALVNQSKPLQTVFEELQAELLQGLQTYARQIGKALGESSNTYVKMAAGLLRASEISYAIWQVLEPLLNTGLLVEGYEAILKQAIREMPNRKNTQPPAKKSHKNKDDIEQRNIEKLIEEGLQQINQPIKQHLSHNLQQALRKLLPLLNRLSTHVAKSMQEITRQEHQEMVVKIKNASQEDKRALLCEYLGLPASATDAAINSAYKKNSLELHPDRTLSLPEEIRVEREEQFKVLTNLHGQIYCTETASTKAYAHEHQPQQTYQPPQPMQQVIEQGIVIPQLSKKDNIHTAPPDYYLATLEVAKQYLCKHGADIRWMNALTTADGRPTVLAEKDLQFPLSEEERVYQIVHQKEGTIGHTRVMTPSGTVVDITNNLEMPKNSCSLQACVFHDNYEKNGLIADERLRIEKSLRGVTPKAVEQKMVDVYGAMKVLEEKPGLGHSPELRIGAPLMQGETGQVVKNGRFPLPRNNNSNTGWAAEYENETGVEVTSLSKQGLSRNHRISDKSIHNIILSDINENHQGGLIETLYQAFPFKEGHPDKLSCEALLERYKRAKNSKQRLKIGNIMVEILCQHESNISLGNATQNSAIGAHLDLHAPLNAEGKHSLSPRSRNILQVATKKNSVIRPHMSLLKNHEGVPIVISSSQYGKGGKENKDSQNIDLANSSPSTKKLFYSFFDHPSISDDANKMKRKRPAPTHQ